MASSFTLNVAKSKPNFFILGAPKTGTTALANYLAAHPEVHFAPSKEPMFFNTDHEFTEFADPAVYQSLFEEAGPEHKAIGEGSVWYLYSDVAVAQIEKTIDGPKYIVCLRNPAALAISLHSQHLYTGYETLKDFDAAWEAQAERRAGRLKSALCPSAKLLLYYEACCLGAQVERLLNHVPRERVHFILHDDLSRDPRGTWLALQVFLNLNDDGRTEFSRINTRKQRKSQKLNLALKQISRMKRNLRLPGAGLGLTKRLQQVNMSNKTTTTISDQMIAHLQSVFTDDIVTLQNLCGRDLNGWTTNTRK